MHAYPSDHQSKQLPTASLKQERVRSGLIAGLLIAALVMSCVWLAVSYGGLRRSIQQERKDYAGEIANQIITSHGFLSREYAAETRRAASIINSTRPQSFSELSGLYPPDSPHRLLLMSCSGILSDTDGNGVFMTNRKFVEQLHNATDVVGDFSSLNGNGDYWLFAAPIDDLQLGDLIYSHAIIAISDDEFRSSLAVSLFDNRGATYIIKSNGSIVTMPNNENAVFSGYNLFYSMAESGAPQSSVDFISSILNLGLSGDSIIDIGKQSWLFSFNSIGNQHAIVVAIPLTLTAAKTYSGFNQVILAAIASILILSLIAVLAFQRSNYREQQRAKISVAAEAKSQFFSKMSHDIRTPLNAIIGLQDLIKQSTDLETVLEYNEKSNMASKYLLSILNDVLDMSRIESGKMTIYNEPFNINQMLSNVEAILKNMASEKGLSFTLKAEDFGFYYLGDMVRIEQVLVNLLNNAIKFTPSGGCVSLTAEYKPNGSTDNFCFTVRDNGIGMSSDYLSRIFKPFEQEQSSFTHEYSGSGLGLSIVHNLVTLMGGGIQVTSQTGSGTVMRVRLPLRRGDKIESAAATPEKEIRSFVGKRVLLAEDNSVNQIVATSILKKNFGIETTVAPDGEEAIRKFMVSDSGYFSLILMDIRMPRTDGLEATRRIRKLSRADAATIPIIALSANAYAEDAALSLSAGMNAHLAKPIDIEALSATLSKFIEK